MTNSPTPTFIMKPFTTAQNATFLKHYVQCNQIRVIPSLDGVAGMQAFVAAGEHGQLKLRGVNSTEMSTYDLSREAGYKFNKDIYKFKVNMQELSDACGGPVALKEILEKTNCKQFGR